MNRFDELKARRQWFDAHFSADEKNFTCPCCGYPTLAECAAYEIYEICNWEDDGQDDADADIVLGGPNGKYSLVAARENFATHQTMYDAEDPKFGVREASRLLIQKFDDIRGNR